MRRLLVLFSMSAIVLACEEPENPALTERTVDEFVDEVRFSPRGLSPVRTAGGVLYL